MVKRKLSVLFSSLILLAGMQSLPLQARLLANEALPAPPKLSGTQAGQDPFLLLNSRDLPDAQRYWREQKKFGSDLIARLPVSQVRPAMVSSVNAPSFQAQVVLNDEAVFFTEPGRDGLARLIKRDWSSGREYVVWVATDARWPVLLRLSPDRKRIAILLSGAEAELQLVSVMQDDVKPVVIKDVASSGPVVWVQSGSAIVYQPRRDRRLAQELRLQSADAPSAVSTIVKRWFGAVDSRMNLVATGDKLDHLIWLEQDSQDQILSLQSASLNMKSNAGANWRTLKAPVGRIQELSGGSHAYLMVFKGSQQLWELGATLRKVWQSSQSGTSYFFSSDSQGIWLADTQKSAKVIQIASDGKMQKQQELPDAYIAQAVFPVSAGLVTRLKSVSGADGWALLKSGLPAEWLQLPLSGEVRSVAEWYGRQVWPENKKSSLWLLMKAGGQKDVRQAVLLTTDPVLTDELPAMMRGWLQTGGVIAQLDIQKLTGDQAVSAIGEAIERLEKEGFPKKICLIATQNQKIAAEYLLRHPGKLGAVYLRGLPDTSLQGRMTDLYDLLRSDAPYPALWLNSAGQDALNHLKLIGAMQLLSRGKSVQFWTQGEGGRIMSETEQEQVLAYFLWQTGSLTLQSVPPVLK